eukprot:gnl/TRDRNA2_/TRDRNA2_37296_c0_seq1.p1 gnl/TRDRNA2_/TRDRNA2_37296_c0~~gnl/TRDRNA2_/TRDRNA2_37296_c0_seq1.p1  ORF type:complete len:516 (+),score=78.35 gnl/TRDRNA2_/TRDRNA2_37296_c0_seq1:105-1550(+)
MTHQRRLMSELPAKDMVSVAAADDVVLDEYQQKLAGFNSLSRAVSNSLVALHSSRSADAANSSLTEEPHKAATMADFFAEAAAGPSRTEHRTSRTMADMIAGASSRQHAMQAVEAEKQRLRYLSAMARIDLEEDSAWDLVSHVPRSGLLQSHNTTPHRESSHSAAVTAWEWGFLGIGTVLLLVLDVMVLQGLPDTARCHFALLIFWILVASIFWLLIAAVASPNDGLDWLAGYFLEIMLSMDNVFIYYIVFCTLETPRRLMCKALFLGLFGSFACRFLFLVAPHRTEMVSSMSMYQYILGIWVAYSGIRHATVGDEHIGDVTQTLAVKLSKRLLGERLGEFYDEEGESVFVREKRTGLRMTLLGLVIMCLSTINVLFGFDVILIKMRTIEDGFINFSSSVIALFAVRALFFAVRDLFDHFSLLKYGCGAILFFVGCELIASRLVYVNALASCAVIAALVGGSVALSALRDATSKGSPPSWR